MEAEEVDEALDELEIRLERLRSLYQQYFLGIEKIEPAVARKDVDRRVWLMRREQIRNTRRRFKLNTLIQRYNTYQQYWQRILREIESGTYARHLARAEKQFGGDALTISGRRRLGQLRRASERPPSRGGTATDAVAVDHREAQDRDAGPAEEAKRAIEDVLGAVRSAPDESAPASRRAPDAVPPSSLPVRDKSAAPSAGRGPVRDLGSLDLDLDFLGHETSSVPSRPPASAPPVLPTAPVAMPMAPPAPPLREERAATARGRAIVPGRAGPHLPPSTPLPLQDRPAPKPRTPPPGAGVRDPAGSPPVAAESREGGLTEERLTAIYSRLVEAKRSTNEGTRGVTKEALAKSLRATLPKLREKHAGRTIDFEVVVRDGKAVVKPVVK